MTSAMFICLNAKLSMMWLTASVHRSFVKPFAIIRSRSKRKKSLDCEGNAVVNFLITTTLSSAVIGGSLYLDISQQPSFSLIIRLFACIEECKATCDCLEDFCIGKSFFSIILLIVSIVFVVKLLIINGL